MSTIERGYNLPTDNFTMIPNAWIRDRRLSRRARGLLIELMSHRPGWKTSVATLAKTGPEGEAAIKSAIKELETIGYLERHIDTDQRGRRTGTRYIITTPPEETCSSAPSGENRLMDTDPSGGNHPMDTTKTDDSPLDDFPPVADQPTKKNTLQEDHLEEEVQEENNRRRVVDGTHDRAGENETAAAAAQARIDHNLEVLRDALRSHGLTASFHKLDTPGRTEVSGLVDRCGIFTLVQAARQLHRPSSPARFVQAWLPTWRELRDSQPAGSKGTCGQCVNGWIENDEHDIVGRCECRGAA
ncbi:helix-turn-helix domain-containing protein [Rhodococcus pyridinivorans]|uniref:helix-turn-helix domain-containing protein n=1 Tax=Rhodococcus pyridinivorans TaxID=103816 RepID=UPI003AAF530B